MDQLADEKFDLALGEPFDACSFAVFQRARISKHISVIAGPTLVGPLIGLPSVPSFVPGNTLHFRALKSRSDRE